MPTRVAICIATRGCSPALLRLLESVGALKVGEDFDVRVVVVDNSKVGPSSDDGIRLERSVRFPVILVHEPRRGIPFARNTSVEVVVNSVDLLAFVDDDEVVTQTWLARHLSTLEATAADVSTGPVLPVLPNGAPSWMADGGFFERPRYSTGTSLDAAATNNTLVRAHVFHRVRPWFDEDLIGVGGSDTEFFERVSGLGHDIVWSDDAVVYEHVSSQRARAGWLLRRRFRGGNGAAIRAAIRNGQTHRLMRASRSTARMVRHLLGAAVTCSKSKVNAMHRLENAATEAGLALGLLGFRYREYRDA